MADDWWEQDAVVGGTQTGSRVGYIPGIPKAKDPLDIESKELEIESKRLSIAKSQRELDSPDGGEKLTDAQRSNQAYYDRASRALKVYDGSGVGPRTPLGSAVSGLPGGESLLNVLPDGVGDNPARRMSEQAKRDFATMILRSDSGANAPETEVERLVSVYFPGPGETDKATLDNYAAARAAALEGLRQKAGLPPEQAPQEPAASYDTGEGRVFTPSAGEQVAVSDNGTHTEDIPELAGVNAKLNQMIKGGASSGQISQYLKSKSIPPAQLMPQVLKILAFRKQNPGYKGDYTVNVDDRIVPNSGFQNLASSGLGAAGIAAADTISGGHLDNAVNALGGNGELANIGIEQMRANNPGSSLAGDVLGGAALFGAGGAAVRGLGAAGGGAEAVGALAPRALAADAATGAYVSSGQGGTQIADPGNMAMGGLLGAGAGAAGRGAINTAASAVSPTGGALAPLYARGVRPTVGQRMGASENWAGRMANRAEQAFGSVPIVGGVQRSARNAAVTEMQTGAFNEALGEIGQQLPKGITKGRQAHAYMQKAFSKAYDKALSGMRYVPDEGLEAEINALAPDAALLTPQSQGILQKMTNDIGEKLAVSGGELSGEQYKLVVSRLTNKIDSLRSSPSGDHELASVLERAKLAIQNAARRSSDPKAVAALDATDRGYAKAVIIENAGKARGGSGGEFNGNQLHAAMQKSDKSRRSRAFLRGEANMQDYAEAAKRLGDELPDSGTPERLAAMGGGAAVAHYVSPIALAPWALDTAANLPGVRQTLGALMAPRESATARAVAEALRRRAQLGGLMAAPGAIEGQ